MRPSLPLVALVAVVSACSAPPPPQETLPEGGALIAQFGEARALATDGVGRLYVVDAAASEVVVLDTTGAVLDRLGGTEDQAFLDVTDVDPTNGQAVFVADAGMGRIVRFTAEGRPAEEIPVPRVLDVESRAGDEPGRPVAVAAGPGEVLYAIEAERGVVLRWDADRQLGRVIGGLASPAPLREPSALAVEDDGTLLVADGDRVVAFDTFGAVERDIPEGALGRVVNLTVADGVALAIGPTAVRRLDGQGGVPVELGNGLVDVAVTRTDIYLLTQTRLMRVSLHREAW
ncbi:MAG: hypothetical protein AAF170_18800 [Bacteroidota bacterium]